MISKSPSVSIILASFFLAGLFAGCLGDDVATPAAPPLVEEPVGGLVIEHKEGSASELKSSFIGDQARRCYTFEPVEPLADACRAPYVVLDELPETETVPAPAADITRISFAETSSDLIVTVEVAELDEDWPMLARPDGTWLRYGVTWGEEKVRENSEYLAWGVGGHTKEQRWIDATYLEVTDGCNNWWICSIDLRPEVVYGQPGAFVFTIPRVIMPAAESGDEISNFSFKTERMYEWDYRYRWSAPGLLGEQEGGFVLPSQRHIEPLDEGTSDEMFVFSTPRVALEHSRMTVSSYEAPHAGLGSADGNPDYDVLHITVDETQVHFNITLEIARVLDDPDHEHGVWLGLGMPYGLVHSVGFDVVNGERIPYAGFDEPRGEEEEWEWHDHPVAFSYEPGEPGKVFFSLDRQDLGSPMKHERLNMLWAAVGVLDEQEHTIDTGAVRSSMFLNSDSIWVGYGPPFWFQNDSQGRPTQPAGVSINDQTGDVDLPASLPFESINEDQFDITYIQAEGRDEKTVQLALGIQDLTRVEIPTGYEAVVYSVGLQLDTGDHMVFYYKDQDNQGYYCAPDTLGTGPSPEDPNNVVWTAVEGRLSHGGRGPESNEGSASGAIAFHVPHACFGMDEGEVFLVDGVSAGTYVLEKPLGLGDFSTVHTVDQVAAGPDDLPFLLGLEPVPDDPEPVPAWYMEPLKLGGQDWNILGVVIAVLLAAGGAIAVWTKRRKLRRYLARVDQAAAIKNLSARETALGELRTLLRADLIAGQVSEGHYAVVMRHIDEAMKHVRVKSIEETFRELPFHIVSKLRSVLDDGVITSDEREMVMDLVDRAEIPAKDKQKVLSRLERWQLVDEVAKA